MSKIRKSNVSNPNRSMEEFFIVPSISQHSPCVFIHEQGGDANPYEDVFESGLLDEYGQPIYIQTFEVELEDQRQRIGFLPSSLATQPPRRED
jgi:hypothetical protein